MNADTQDQFELIHIVLIAAEAYDESHNIVGGGRVIIHADNFCSWAWGAGVGRVKESIIEDNSDDTEFETYHSSSHPECIAGFSNNTGNQQPGKVEHMRTYSNNSPRALPVKQTKHQHPTSCARTKLRERENMMMKKRYDKEDKQVNHPHA